VISSICHAINAVPDATAILQSAKYHDINTEIGRLIQATCRAWVGPRIRFERSITRYTSGKLNAPHVSQSLIGMDTRILEMIITKDIRMIASEKSVFGCICEKLLIDFKKYIDSSQNYNSIK
jgi:hypothetical protein